MTNAENQLTPRDIMGPTGRIAARIPHYEDRPQQLEMAEAVAAAIRAKQHLIVEAGTGVGKSYAYLVPAILAATSGDESNQRIVISTQTISLQEQLLRKDIPLLNSVIPREFTTVLVKGRGNYLSLRRLENARRRSSSLFVDQEEVDQLHDIHVWSQKTGDGSLSDLTYKPDPTVWSEVASDHGNCMGLRVSAIPGLFLLQRSQPRTTRPSPNRESCLVLFRSGFASQRREPAARLRYGDSG